ncbi:MAG: sel1 repeat family protein, partial [Magnetococcales bacterium]|nr:sel1 repeat family protein [Magnetococcales bacterium]
FARLGHPEAACLAGLLYAGGLGTRHNLSKAQLYLAQAKQGGNQQAGILLQQLTTSPTSLNIPEELARFAATLPDNVPPEPSPGDRDNKTNHAAFLAFLQQPALQEIWAGNVIKRLTNPYQYHIW